MIPGFLYTFLTWCLRKFSPERAHHLAVAALRRYQWVRYCVMRRKLIRSREIAIGRQWKVSSRIGLGAGFDKNAECFAGLATLGFGFIEVGTVTPIPQPGNPRPRLFRIKNRGLVNRMGFNNCGLTQFKKNIECYRSKVPGLLLLANVGKGKDTPLENAASDYAAGLTALKDSVDGFVVNVSSPNTPNLVSLQNESFIKDIAGAIEKNAPGKTVLVKLSPDLIDSDLEHLIAVIGQQPQISGVVLTNTSRKFAEKDFPEGGGASGPFLLERSLKLVKKAREILGPEKVIIGVGGVSSRLDYERMLGAGADLVEIYTAFIYEGPELVHELSKP